ncbi:hypothetical protein F5Y05DRAFT_308230 [Hypoxylon sp. FL0543]|nr:hypothetical protein F5Y05DRAFT_308230 [Hypoxylon sp. FL0543]
MDSFELTSRDSNQPDKAAPPLPPSRFQFSRKVLFTSLLASASLLAVASVIEITLAAEGSQRGPPTDLDIGGSFFTEPKNFTLVLSDYPANVFGSQDTLKLASASLSLICAVVLGGVAGYAFAAGPVGTLFVLRQALFAVLGVNTLFCLATFLYAFIAHGLSAHFDLSYAVELTKLPYFILYDRGTFDLETWACETKNLPNYDTEGEMHTLCSVETGARWMTLFVFLLACSSFVFVWLDRRGEKQLMTTWKKRRASWRDDYY